MTKAIYIAGVLVWIGSNIWFTYPIGEEGMAPIVLGWAFLFFLNPLAFGISGLVGRRKSVRWLSLLASLIVVVVVLTGHAVWAGFLWGPNACWHFLLHHRWWWSGIYIAVCLIAYLAGMHVGGQRSR